MSLQQIVYYFFGLVAAVSALAFVTRRSPIAAALWLVNTMFTLAAMYILLDAQFVGAVQVLVYAGAIMVVFLFVVMLLNLGQAGPADLRPRGARVGAGVLALALLAELGVLAGARFALPDLAPEAAAVAPGGVAPNVVSPVADSLFTDQLLAFELTSVLLLVAIVGAVLLAQRGRAERPAGVPALTAEAEA